MREQRSNSTDSKLYLKVPLRRGLRRFETTGVEESIENFVGVILTTRPGSFKFNPEFGCRIWDQEFKRIKRGRFKEDVQKAVQEAVERYESRLKKVKVDVSVSGVEENRPVVVEISVSGTISATGSPFERVYTVDWQRAKRTTSPYMGAP